MLKALVDYYEYLRAQNKEGVVAPGWSPTKVTAFLDLDQEGNLVNVIPVEEKRGVERTVPRQVERSSGVAANLLCDTSSYLLGIDAKGKPERSVKCFECARELHTKTLSSCESTAGKAIRSFFEKWDPTEAASNQVVQEHEELLLAGRNLAFSIEGHEALNDEAIVELVNKRASSLEDADSSASQVSLISGEKLPVARIHPKIKGVRGTQSSGAVLVGFNAPSFTSYGHDEDQGLNAPIGEYEAFAYSTALNYLLSDPGHHIQVDDTTIVFWTLEQDEERSEDIIQMVEPGALLQLSSASAEEPDETPNAQSRQEKADQKISSIMKAVEQAKNVGDSSIDAPFFVMGLAPNAARVSVRFFLVSAFGDLVTNISRHYERMQLARGPFGRTYLSPQRIIYEVENPNSRTSTAARRLTGALIRAILTDTAYPNALFQHAMARLKATQDNEEKHVKKVDYGRAAIIRAFLIKNYGISEKELTVDLNTERGSVPYNLGRLFAAMETVQEEAAWVDERKLNSTIADRYFDSACATPGIVFPVIGKLNNTHLCKLRKNGRGGAKAKLIADLNMKIHARTEHYPSRLTLEEQGDFVMGYWCQRQDFFTTKDKTETKTEEN